MCVARERGETYNPGVADDAGDDQSWSPAADALAQARAALAALDQVDWSREDNATVRAAAVDMQRLVNQLSAQALRPVADVDRREAYIHEGAVSTASWLRNRVNMDPAVAARVCAAARRLRGLPLLSSAFAAGDVSLAHVTAITEVAVPNRFEAISSVEKILVDHAITGPPREVRALVKAVRDVVDPDGSDFREQEPIVADHNDPRRYWHQHRTYDGMVEGSYCLDGVAGEAIASIFDAYATADPADLPPSSRRSPAQRRADAMRAALLEFFAAGPKANIQGQPATILGMFDLLKVMDPTSARSIDGELRRTGRVSDATIAKLALDAKFIPVFTLGGYRVVAVGRTYRTLPPWLRPLLQMIHRQCRGPDCDRPAAWCEAAHQHDYAKGGNTDLNETIPLCKAHHDLLTYRGWTIDMDADTGVCTWTAPDGRTIDTYPPA